MPTAEGKATWRFPPSAPIRLFPLDCFLIIQHYEITGKFSLRDGVFRYRDRQKVALLISLGNFRLKNFCRFHHLSTSIGRFQRLRRVGGVKGVYNAWRNPPPS
jgi:hypothetical protein